MYDDLKEQIEALHSRRTKLDKLNAAIRLVEKSTSQECNIAWKFLNDEHKELFADKLRTFGVIIGTEELIQTDKLELCRLLTR